MSEESQSEYFTDPSGEIASVAVAPIVEQVNKIQIGNLKS